MAHIIAAIGAHGAADAVAGAAEACIDGALEALRLAPDDGLVGAFQRSGEAVVGKLLGEMAMGMVVFRHHHHPGGVTVKPVDDARPLDAADARQAVAAMVDQRVDQRSRPVARTRMDHETGLLVEHDQVVILIEDFERDILANRFGILGLGHDQLDPVARMDLVLGLPRGDIVDGDRTGLDQRLEAAAGDIGLEFGGQPGVEPAARVLAHHQGFAVLGVWWRSLGFPRRLGFVKRGRIVQSQGPPGKEW